MKRTLALIVLGVVLATAGCGSDSAATGGSSGGGGNGGNGGNGGTDPARAYSAKIVRTTYGIPHITGSDFGNLGYGLGYAYAQDNFCVLMREIVIANGEAARYWGEDFANSDFVYSWANSDDFIENEFIPAASQEIQDLSAGYAAGMTRYLADTGVDNLAEGPEGCRGEEWVRPITQSDVAKRMHKLILLGGLDSGQVGAIDRIMDGSAAAPTMSAAKAVPAGPQSVQLASRYVDDLPVDRMGSNAYGIGAEGSQTDYGILLGNPHFPWQGPQRFYVSHLTVPGEYDMMGGSLHGVPLILVGFNQDVAWSHTVSTAQRFTFFELELLPDDPYKYRYDDEVRDIEAVPYTIEVKLEDGTIEERTENIYFSHYGPIMDLGPAAAHGPEIQAEIGIADLFRARCTGHRLGDQQSATGAQRPACRAQQLQRQRVIVIVQHPHQRDQIDAVECLQLQEIAAMRVHLSIQAQPIETLSGTLSDRRQIEQCHAQMRPALRREGRKNTFATGHIEHRTVAAQGVVIEDVAADQRLGIRHQLAVGANLSVVE